MKRCTLLFSLVCVLLTAQQPKPEHTKPKLYERFETKTDERGQQLQFFDKNNVVTSEIFADKTGRISIHTSNNEDAWIQLESIKEGNQTTNTITTSSGKTMKIMLEYANSESSGARGLIVKRFNGSDWEAVSREDLPKLGSRPIKAIAFTIACVCDVVKRSFPRGPDEQSVLVQ